MTMSDFKRTVKRVWLALSLAAHLISVPLVTIELWLMIGGRPSITVPAVIPNDLAFQIAADVWGSYPSGNAMTEAHARQLD